MDNQEEAVVFATARHGLPSLVSMSSAPSGPDTFDFRRYEGSPRPRGTPGPGAPRTPLGRLFDREPPCSIEAEMSLLGSMILDPRVIADVIAIVKGPEAFYDERHGLIFQALIEVFDKHHSGDLVQLNQSLADKGVLQQIGGAEYLVTLAQDVPTAANAPHFARIIAEKYKLRRLIDAAGQILYDTYHAGKVVGDDAARLVDTAESRIFEIAQEDQTSDPQALAELLQIEFDRIEASEGQGISGLPTGFTDLDKLTGGLQRGEMIIIAARPSMGKTALALNIAEEIARGGRTKWDNHPKGAGVGVAVFSLEMTKTAVTQRFISAMSGFSSQDIRGGRRLSPAEYSTLTDACDELKQCPIFVDDTPGLSVMALRARARRMVSRHDVRCVIVDYLQLLTSPGQSRESRQVEVSAISRGIKALARELDIPVICLSQLNRASEQREGNRPRMSDLRESGSIEQDADVVMLLHREDYYHVANEDWAANNPEKIGTAELIIAKQRNGPTDVVRLTWDAETTRFKSHAGGYTPRASDDTPFVRTRPVAASAFAEGPRTGPVPDFRDGGGPEREDDVPGEEEIPI